MSQRELNSLQKDAEDKSSAFFQSLAPLSSSSSESKPTTRSGSSSPVILLIPPLPPGVSTPSHAAIKKDPDSSLATSGQSLLTRFDAIDANPVSTSSTSFSSSSTTLLSTSVQPTPEVQSSSSKTTLPTTSGSRPPLSRSGSPTEIQSHYVKVPVYEANMRRIVTEQEDQRRKLEDISRMLDENQAFVSSLSHSVEAVTTTANIATNIIGRSSQAMADNTRKLSELEALCIDLQEATRNCNLQITEMRLQFASSLSPASRQVSDVPRPAPALLRQPSDDNASSESERDDTSSLNFSNTATFYTAAASSKLNNAVIHDDGISPLGHNSLFNHDGDLLTSTNHDNDPHHSDFPNAPILVYREKDSSQALARFLMNGADSSSSSSPRLHKAFDQARLQDGAITVGTLFVILSAAMLDFKDILAESTYSSPPRYPSIASTAKQYSPIHNAIIDGFYQFLLRHVPQQFRQEVQSFVQRAHRIALVDNTMFFTMLYYACKTTPSISLVAKILRKFHLDSFPRVNDAHRLPGYFRTIYDCICTHLYVEIYDIEGALKSGWNSSPLFKFVITFDQTKPFPTVPASFFKYPFQSSTVQYYYLLFAPFPDEATTLYPVWKLLHNAVFTSAADFANLWATVTYSHCEDMNKLFSALTTVSSTGVLKIERPPSHVLVYNREHITWKSCTEGLHEKFKEFFTFFNKHTNATSRPDYSSSHQDQIDPAHLPTSASMKSVISTASPSTLDSRLVKRAPASVVSSIDTSSSRPYAVNIVPRAVYAKLPLQEKQARSAAYHQDKAQFLASSDTESHSAKQAAPLPTKPPESSIKLTAPTRNIRFDDTASIRSSSSTIASVATTVPDTRSSAPPLHRNERFVRPRDPPPPPPPGKPAAHLLQASDTKSSAPADSSTAAKRWSWKSKDKHSNFISALDATHANKDKRSQALLLQLGQQLVDDDPTLLDWVNDNIADALADAFNDAHLSDDIFVPPADTDEITEMFDPAFANDPYYSPDSGLIYEDTDANVGFF